jgi:hypothetical protein
MKKVKLAIFLLFTHRFQLLRQRKFWSKIYFKVRDNIEEQPRINLEAAQPAPGRGRGRGGGRGQIRGRDNEPRFQREIVSESTTK